MKFLSKSEQIYYFHGGMPNKVLKLKEECDELIHELKQGKIDKEKARMEIADVLSVLDQIMVGLGLTREEVGEAFDFKQDREIGRIYSGYYKRH